MIALKGIYDGTNITLLDKSPIHKKYKVVVTFIEEIKQTDSDDVRAFASQSNGFEFWKNEQEDLYQDYVKAKK
jgi:predicted metallopeptidase